MTPQIKINQVQTPESRLRWLLLTLAQIKRGLFQKKGYLLLSNPQVSSPHYLAHTVILKPQLLDHLNQNFDWQKFDSHFWFDQTNRLTADLTPFAHLLPFVSSPCNAPNYDQTAILQAFEILLNIQNISQLTINTTSTQNGPGISYTIVDNHTLHMGLRTDTTQAQLVRAAVASTLRHQLPNKSWQDYQTIPDFLVYHTKIAQILKSKPPKQNFQLHNFQSLYQQSCNNFSRLGFPIQPSLSLKNNQIELVNYGPIDFLSPTEEKILTHLILNSTQVVSFDDIGDLVWKNLDDFSLQAICKHIQRIRKSLHMIGGLNKQIIFTKRKQGYLLLN